MALSHLVLHVGNLGLQCEGCTIVYELLGDNLRGKDELKRGNEKLRGVW